MANKIHDLDGFVKAEVDEDGVMIWVYDAVGETEKIHLSWICLQELMRIEAEENV